MNNKIEEYLLKLQNLDAKKRYLLFVGVLLAFFVLDFLILMRPQLASLAKINKKSVNLSAKILKSQDNIDKLGFYNSQVKIFKENVSEEHLRISPKEEVPLVLEKISQIADKNKFNVDRIMPLSDQKEVLLEGNEQRYLALPVFVSGRSSYHNFGRFINEIERDNLFFGIVSLSIKPLEDSKINLVDVIFQTIVFEDIKEEDKNEK
ncbi:MAG: type 4a pilus biogenesis protein PilO [Candidatus Zapsychrus exili]|nr:type 4a pilus biogenesis protein PilO [Candidatus Zapsychrus exili]